MKTDKKVKRSKLLERSGYQDQVFVEIVKLPCGEIVKPIEERMTPRRAIRMYCVYCNGWKIGEVTNCIDTECLLYPHRFKFNRKKAGMTALKMIRKYCREECCAGEHVVEDIKNFQAIGCPFYQYRFGHNPKRKGIGRKGNIDALRKWREQRKVSEYISK